MKNHTTTRKYIVIACLIIVAVVWRVINHSLVIAPNLELITAASALAAITFGLDAAIIVPISSIIISDLIIGNSSIFVFTWTSFAIIGLSSTVLRKFNDRPKTQILYSIGFAIIASLLFFAITNFGVWVQGWYPSTISGLVECFVMAIPFYRTMLIGNVIFVPTAVGAWQLVKHYQSKKQLVVDALISK